MTGKPDYLETRGCVAGRQWTRATALWLAKRRIEWRRLKAPGGISLSSYAEDLRSVCPRREDRWGLNWEHAERPRSATAGDKVSPGNLGPTAVRRTSWFGNALCTLVLNRRLMRSRIMAVYRAGSSIEMKSDPNMVSKAATWRRREMRRNGQAIHPRPRIPSPQAIAAAIVNLDERGDSPNIAIRKPTMAITSNAANSVT